MTKRHSALKVVDDAADSVFENRDVEVDQETELAFGQSQIGQQLGVMHRGEVVDGFQFHDHSLIDSDVDPIAGRNLHPFVDQRQLALHDESDAAQLQFVFQAFLVGVLQATGAEKAMHLDGSGYDRTRQFVRGHFRIVRHDFDSCSE